jgi:transposase
VLLRELRERGYTGGYTMLKIFVAGLKPKQTVATVTRFETRPGEQISSVEAHQEIRMRRCEVLGASMGRDICCGQRRQTAGVLNGRRTLADHLSRAIWSHPEQPSEFCAEPGSRSHEKLLQPKRFGLA